MRQINEPNSARRHSRLGIASTVIGGGLPLLLISLLILSLIPVYIPYVNKSDFGRNWSDSLFIVFVFVGLSAPLLHLTGLILGVIGAFSSETRKYYIIAGIILNLILGLIGAVIVIYFWLILQAIGGFH